MGFWIKYGFCKGNTKFIELNSFHCVQGLNWGGKLHSLDLLMKYEKWGECWLKNNETWVTQVQVMPFWTNMYLSWPQTCITHYKYTKCVVKLTQCTHCHMKPSYTSMVLKLYRYLVSKRGKRPFFYMCP